MGSKSVINMRLLLLYLLTCNVSALMYMYVEYKDGLVQDYYNSSALAVELLQSCTKPLICRIYRLFKTFGI